MLPAGRRRQPKARLPVRFRQGASPTPFSSNRRPSPKSIGERYAILARQGGDGFVILLPGNDLEEAFAIAEGLREVWEARALIQQGPAAQFTISVGVGTEADSASGLGDLLRQTDAALYQAKAAGGGNQGVEAGAVCSSQFSAEHRTVPDALGQTVGTTSTRLVAECATSLRSVGRH
jgi:hypothetical protein